MNEVLTVFFLFVLIWLFYAPKGDKYSMTVWMHQQSETRARFYQLQQQIAADLAKANDDDEDMEEATSP